MNERIMAFSVPFGPPGATFTPKQLENRKREIWKEIETWVPASRFLIHSCLVERVVAENNQLLVIFDLVPHPQLALKFEENEKSSSAHVTSVLRDLVYDLKQLKQSFVGTGVRLNNLATQIGSGHQIDDEDIKLGQFLSRKQGGQFKLRFADGDIQLHAPLIPIFVGEEGLRTVVARVVKMSRDRVELLVLKEEDKSEGCEDIGFACGKWVMHRPPSSSQFLGPLLFSAMENNMKVELRVQVVLSVVSRKPSHLEFVDFVNTNTIPPITTK